MENYINYIKENFDYSEDFLNYMFSFNKIISISIKHDSQVFKAFRVQHNNDFGIYKGGFRIYKNVSLSEMKTLAFIMSLKNNLYGLPFGGAKGGICIDKERVSEETISQIVKEYTKLIINDIGEDWDVPAPDVGTNEKTMQIMFEEYKKLKNKLSFSVVTGKPDYLMGLSYRKKSTGYGVVYFLINLLKDLNLKNPKIGIQGFGNVGYYVAEKLSHLGYKISGVSDSKGGIVCNNIDLKNLIKIKKEAGSVINYPDCNKYSQDEFLEQEFDILILAAVENSINKENVEKIKSKIIVEASNAGIDLDVENKLLEKGKIILPDIMVNGGGVYISYFEWLKGKTYQDFTEEFLDNKLTEKAKEIYQKLKIKDKNFRKAAYKQILDNFFNLYKKRF